MQTNKTTFFIKLSLVLLLSNLVFRLVDLSKMIFNYPLASEAVTLLGQLFFLKDCGFHQFCPYWYNGIITFQVSPPGWYFFALPFYVLTNNLLLAAYVTFVLSILFAFIAFVYIGKLLKFSKIQALLFFALVFGNNIMMQSIGFIRPHEQFAWTSFFICGLVILYYNNRNIDAKFIAVTSFSYFVTILAHQSVAIVLTFLFAGFFLSRVKLEKIKAALPVILGLLSSAFWWWPYLQVYLNGEISLKQTAVASWWIIDGFNISKLYIFVLPILFILIFGIAWRSENYDKKFMKFYLPTIVLSVLFITGIVRFIPFFKNVSTYIYFTYFIFLISYLLIAKINMSKLLSKVLFLAAIFFVVVNALWTPFFAMHGQADKDILTVAQQIDGRYIFVNKFPAPIFPPAYYGYLATYSNKSTASGWYMHGKSDWYVASLKIFNKLNTTNCDVFLENSKNLNLTNFVGYENTCNLLAACKLREVSTSGQACLYAI